MRSEGEGGGGETVLVGPADGSLESEKVVLRLPDYLIDRLPY